MVLWVKWEFSHIRARREHLCSLLPLFGSPFCCAVKFWCRLEPRPPHSCFCGLPLWERQRNIMKHKPTTSTQHTQSWLCRQMDKEQDFDMTTLFYEEIYFTLHSSLCWGNLIEIHIWKITQLRSSFDLQKATPFLFYLPYPFISIILCSSTILSSDSKTPPSHSPPSQSLRRAVEWNWQLCLQAVMRFSVLWWSRL